MRVLARVAAFGAVFVALGQGALATRADVRSQGISAAVTPPPGAVSFKRFGVDQGLDSQHIVRLTQDRDGFIWVATVAGLYRFDGRRFELFGAESGLDPGVVTDVVPAGTLGSVWVTQPRRISLLRNGKATDVSQLGLPLDTATVYQYVNVVANEGSDAFATVRGVPYEFRDGRFQLVRNSPVQRVTERNTYVGRLFGEGRDRELYLAHGNLRVLYRNHHGVWSRQDLPDFEGRPIAAILKDRRGRIWMRTDRALWRLDTFGAKPIQVVSGLSATGGERPSLAEDRLGRIWTPTERGLLCVEERGHWLLGEAEGLPKGGAFTVLVDQDGSLWAGGPELLRVKGRMSCTSFTTSNGLPVDNIQALLRTRDGRVWVGTSEGVSWLEGNRFVLAPETSGISISALAEDASGAVWAAGSRPTVADRDFIALKPAKSRTFRIIPIAIGPRESAAIAMASDPNGRGMWIATGTNGVNLIRPLAGGGFSVERARAFGRDFTYTTVLYVDPRRRLWSVTGELGLVYLDKGEWHRVPNPPDIALNPVSAVAMDARGELWAAAWDGKFVVRLKEEGGTWRLAESVTHPAMTGDIVTRLALDPSGALWMATSRGLKRWDGRRCERIASTEGLPGDDANNTLVVDPAGPVWVGTTLGLGRYDPAAAAAPVSPPPTRILAVTDGMDQPIVDLPGLTIPHRRGTLTFAFATPQYLNESKIVQEVRLVGLEDNWHVAAGGQARYTRLPPGQYRFEARSTDAEGRTGAPEAFAFRIEPAWYQTWWSYAIAIAALCAGAVGAFRWRVRRHVRAERELQKRVTAALADIKTLHGLLPICAWCKKVRDDGGYWNQIEEYVSEHSQAEFSHGICPECRKGRFRDALGD
jgi:ligand-binding sensor domain-containing protein